VVAIAAGEWGEAGVAFWLRDRLESPHDSID
jgi:hypothetical protein